MKALASHTVCSAHALLRFTPIFSVRARVTNAITIPGGLAAAACSLALITTGSSPVDSEAQRHTTIN